MTETTNLSFSYKVKEELSAHFGNARHCQIAELSAIVNICGGIASFGKTFCLKIQTENFLVAKKCFTLLQNTFNIRVDISVRSGGKRRRIYLLLIRNAFDAARVLMATGILHKDREQTAERGGALAWSGASGPWTGESCRAFGLICCRRRRGGLPVFPESGRRG